jgi:transposase
VTADEAPAEPAAGNDHAGSSKPATNLPAGNSGPASACDPHREAILAMVQQGLTAQRIYQDLVREHGFGHAYDSVKRYVRKLRAATPLAFRRMECSPGSEAQVDFGTGAPVVNANGRRRPYVFRFVLSHSRKGYSEVVFRQRTEDFLQCLENALWHIGGVPATIVIDNLKAAVKHADWFDPQLNPRLLAFCEHYGTVILPTKPYTPRHKGKVERGVGYVQENALKGRTFESLQAENLHLQQWESSVADRRIHGTTRQQVCRVFEEVERKALGPLPAGRFPFFHEARRSVHRDAHVEVAKAYYSVPPEYMGRQVWVRWDGRMVRVFNQRMEQIAVHAQREPGKFSTQDQHIVAQKISGVERGTAWQMQRVSLIGEHAEKWAAAMLLERGIAGVRVLEGLRALASRYDTASIERACQIALTHRAFHLRAIRELVKRGGQEQEEMAFLQEHQIIREMSSYGNIVRAAIRREPVVLEPVPL